MDFQLKANGLYEFEYFCFLCLCDFLYLSLSLMAVAMGPLMRHLICLVL